MKSELKAANQQQALGIAILLLVLIISPIIIFLVRNATATIHIFSLTLSTKEQVKDKFIKMCNSKTYFLFLGIDTRKTENGGLVVSNIAFSSCKVMIIIEKL